MRGTANEASIRRQCKLFFPVYLVGAMLAAFDLKAQEFPSSSGKALLHFGLNVAVSNQEFTAEDASFLLVQASHRLYWKQHSVAHCIGLSRWIFQLPGIMWMLLSGQNGSGVASSVQLAAENIRSWTRIMCLPSFHQLNVHSSQICGSIVVRVGSWLLGLAVRDVSCLWTQCNNMCHRFVVHAEANLSYMRTYIYVYTCRSALGIALTNIIQFVGKLRPAMFLKVGSSNISLTCCLVVLVLICPERPYYCVSLNKGMCIHASISIFGAGSDATVAPSP